MTTKFSAPWSNGVKVVSALVVVLMLTLVFASCGLQSDKISLGVRVATISFALLVLIGTGLFAVSGYLIADNQLVIERLGWRNRIPLSDVVSVTIDREAMKGSLRLFGSGGLFGFYGWFRNGKLGVYRAYCTDSNRCVVLRLVDRTIVVSPDDPERFLEEIRRGPSAC